MNKGTDAHQVVSTFMNESSVEKSNFPRHMVQAKRLLEKHNLEDVLYALKMYGSKMYSLGYLSDERMLSAIAKRQQEQLVSATERFNGGEDIAERNQGKLQRLYSQSRFGERNTFDLLGKQREDS